MLNHEILNKIIEQKKQASEQKIIVNKNNFEKIRADIDYIAMMCDVELEEELP